MPLLKLAGTVVLSALVVLGGVSFAGAEGVNGNYLPNQGAPRTTRPHAPVRMPKQHSQVVPQAQTPGYSAPARPAPAAPGGTPGYYGQPVAPRANGGQPPAPRVNNRQPSVAPAPAQAPRRPAAISGIYHGNVESRIYHNSSCRYYNSKNATAIFRSPSEARSQGFQPCKVCGG